MPKQDFNEKLTTLLKTHPDFLDDSGKLIPAAVRDHAWRLDHNLIKLLLTDNEENENPFWDTLNAALTTI